ncbi:hypothetical protein BLA23254_06397 [Burkholderia lata]|uniref:Uncharacterized protein n=1 Tax=Burkholderia lata (strain ATCC 17760 / DSM 23089 / LMG 22485 / NCIMB 9086 / R18194 / 383) TaxID=482957 RepID=A0A6P2R9Q8_BURL3|nr:hypothetical protein [Burkholderia lata]VWC31842.1 hypothetical protein BLA23254_06397 [Burkholderia lata]
MVEPITTVLALGAADAMKDYVKDQLKDVVGDFFKESIVARWSTRRADQFLSAFVEEVRKEADVRTTSADLNHLLKAIAQKEKHTSALFDAYRRVALSASRKIGPQVIGVLVARILLQDRDVTDEDEQIFEAAEAMNDRDFDRFFAWMKYAREEPSYVELLQTWSMEGCEGAQASILVQGMTGPDTSFNDFDLYMPDAPFNLYRSVGPFAVKLANCGLLEESAQPRSGPRDPKGTNFYVLVSHACEEFYQLAMRACHG